MKDILLWVAIGILVMLFLLGDARSQHNSRTLSPEMASAVHIWKTLEPVDNRIRVLWIDQDYVPFVNAGSEICTHTLNKFLMQKPYKWDIWVATPGSPKQTYENVRCFDLYDTDTFCKVLESSHILQSHSYYYRKFLLYLSRITGKPFVGWVHTDNYVSATKYDYVQWVDTRITGRQWTVFNSNSLMDSVGVPVPNSKICIPVVDYRDYAVEEKHHKRRYVTLSNVNENKGGALLIELARACPDIEFLGVIGGYRKQITTNELPNLKYVAHTNRIKDIYEQTWVQIMPSLEETWGRTAVEAMSSGIPVVVSPTPGLRECCQDAAIYIDRKNVSEWAEILRKLKKDREFYNSRCKMALERARALDPRPLCADIEDWLEREVKPSGKSGRNLWTLEKNILIR
jgi:glycosyltransferase involved in cell wall biosynthesis